MERNFPTHPILWCEARRKCEEKKVAQECIFQANLIKQKNQLNKLRDMDEVNRFISDSYLRTFFFIL